MRGESNILYIGKTSQNLRQRYLQYSENLASKSSGKFYNYILKNYGAISFGYIITRTPKESEAMFFKQYLNRYLEYPPKSKVG